MIGTRECAAVTPILVGVSLLLILCRPIAAERLPIKTYTTADGLAHNNINRIVRDSRGFLWFCTAEGLSRFDGYTFTNYTTDQGLPQRNITDFLETRGGQFWLSTNAGLVRFDPGGTPDARREHHYRRRCFVERLCRQTVLQSENFNSRKGDG